VRFFEGRFKSQSLLDEGALLNCMSYVDLNLVRASIAEPTEDSEYTSIQERIKAYRQKQKPDKAEKLSPKLFPFKSVKSNELSNFIDFNEKDYFRLVDWIGRAIRDDKKGSIPEDLLPILERLKLNPDTWLTSIKQYKKDYFTAVGAIDRIKAYAESLGKRWFQGQSAAISNYRIVLV
jgi:hypothetical protein